MRKNEEAKTATRSRILKEARALFKTKGFRETTTRDIATAAEIAAGTLFNYFPTKEAIGRSFIEDAFLNAERAVVARTQSAANVDERLFLFVATLFRELRPLKKTLRPALESALASLLGSTDKPGSLGFLHVEILKRTVLHGRIRRPIPFLELHTYLSFFVGTFVFWLDDNSAHAEKSLAVLDHGLNLFVDSISLALHENDTVDFPTTEDKC